MINTHTLSRPYSKAAFAFASAENKVNDWLEQLSLAAAFVENEELMQQLANPALTREQKVDLLVKIGNGKFETNVVNFLQALGSKDRLSLLPVICEQFAALKAEAESTLDAEVESAYELSADQLQTLASALSKRLERTVNVHSVINQNLIGGVLIRAGDVVIDGSIRGKLNKLADALKS